MIKVPQKMAEELELKIEELEERIAPTAVGQLGYEGQPGNQGGSAHKP